MTKIQIIKEFKTEQLVKSREIKCVMAKYMALTLVQARELAGVAV